MCAFRFRRCIVLETDADVRLERRDHVNNVRLEEECDADSSGTPAKAAIGQTAVGSDGAILSIRRLWLLLHCECTPSYALYFDLACRA